MMNKKNITGIILSGGKSSRMGTDKAFLSLNGKPFMQHSIDALKPLVAEVFIVSNNKNHDVFGVKRMEDAIENAGPLAGVYTGLKQSKTDYNLVLSCDIPLINATILQKLIAAIDDVSEIIQIENQGKTMPLIALYKRQCASKFFTLLNQGDHSLQYAINLYNTNAFTLIDEASFFNHLINTPTELKIIGLSR